MYTVLVVDDNQRDREGIRDLLDWQALGVEVLGLAANGAEGYELARDLRPDLVLTDIAMPMMDGLEMTRRITAALPRVKTIFMSCYDEFDFAKRAIDLDACAYVLKPIDLDELAQAITRVTAQIAAENERRRILDELRMEVRDNLPVLQEQLVRDLIHGRLRYRREIEARMQDLEMLQQEALVVLLIQLNDPRGDAANQRVEDRYLTVYGVKDSVARLLLRDHCGHSVTLDHRNLCTLVWGDWSDQEESLSDILDGCDAVRCDVQSRFGLGVTIGVSDMARDVAGIPGLFQSAQYAVRAKFHGEADTIILASEVTPPQEIYDYQFGNLKREIESLLEGGDRDGIADWLERYYPAGARYSEAAMRSLGFSIINVVRLVLAERNDSIHEVLGSEPHLWETLTKLETQIEVKAWLLTSLVRVQEHLAAQCSSRYRRIVDDIRAIIDERYADIQNIDQVVASLYISASHANAIFRQQTGKTIFEYVVEKRVDVARQLLTDPYTRIYEVAASVGYTSSSYFTTVFKAHTGLTPKQYRDRWSQGCSEP